MIKKNHICRCGKTVEEIRSYFSDRENMRVTVCDKCADMYGLTEKNGWRSKNYIELNEEEKKTQDINAKHN